MLICTMPDITPPEPYQIIKVSDIAEMNSMVGLNIAYTMVSLRLI